MHGRFVLAVDAGSNQVSVLAVRRDGSLRPVQEGTVSSGGSQPVSIAVHRNVVYVASAGAGATNYTGFVLGFNGVLHPLPHSTVSLAVNTAQPSISSYAIDDDGSLTLLASKTLNPVGLAPVDARLSPDGATLWVVDGGTRQVSAFSVNGGSLNELSSPTALPIMRPLVSAGW